MTEHQATQSARFKRATREAECDEDEAGWVERLKQVAKQQPDKPE